MTGLSSYNESWIAGFRQTVAFKLWDSITDSVIFDLVEPRHPCEGQTHLVQDVGIRLAQGVHDLHLDENLAPAREAIGKGIATGTQSVWALYSNVRSDLAKRQAEYKERKDREARELKEKAASTPAVPASSPSAEVAPAILPAQGSQRSGQDAVLLLTMLHQYLQA